MRFVKWFLFTVFALLTLTYAARGQSVSPLAAEAKMGREIRGSFTVRNVGIQELRVVVEAKSFSMDQRGQTTFRPLDPGITVKLDSMSTVLGARQFHSFSYTVSCFPLDKPCWVVFYSGFSKGHTAENGGIMVRVELPTTLYICPGSGKNCREKIHKEIFKMP